MHTPPSFTFAYHNVAIRSVMPALSPVSRNFTGTVLPALRTDVPFAAMGARTPDQGRKDWRRMLLQWMNAGARKCQADPPDGQCQR